MRFTKSHFRWLFTAVVLFTIPCRGQVITEIMYNPPESGTDSLEFIELFNNQAEAVDLSGFSFSLGISFTFTDQVLEPGGYCLLCADSSAILAAFGIHALQFSGALSNSGEALVLRDADGNLVDSVSYDDAFPWPLEPDGYGPSLRLCDPEDDNSLGENWSASDEFAYINANGDTIWATPGAGCFNPPTAEFEADITLVESGGSVRYTDLSVNDPTEWVWTFIGGNPGFYLGQSPPHVVYENAGTYNVALYVSNASGNSTEVKEGYITVGDIPEAAFSAFPTSLFEEEAVDFTDASSGSPEHWEWTFEGGDPPSSSEQHPSGVVYSLPGLYDVTLTVSSLFGASTLLREDYIDVIPVGVGENGSQTVSLCPNPSRGTFIMRNPGLEKLSIELTDPSGRMVYKQSLSSGDHTIRLDDRAKGIYFLKLIRSKGDGYVVRKVVVW